MRNAVKRSEFLFVLYWFLFGLLKPFYTFLPSTVLLYGAIGLIILSDVIWHQDKEVERVKVYLAFIFSFASLFIINLIFFMNERTTTYLINFILYAIIPLYLLLNVRDFSKVLTYFFHFSLVYGLIVIADPFFNYQQTGGYMEYGFALLMSVYLGLVLGYFYFRKTYCLPLLLVVLTAMGIWGNKGAVLTGGLVLAAAIFYTGSSFKRLVLTALATVTFFNLTSWLLAILDYIESLGVKTYALTTLRQLISSDSEGVTSLRTDIWTESLTWIDKHPFIGNGIGSFDAATGRYTHNLFADIAVSFGVFALFLFLIIFIDSLATLLKNPNRQMRLFQALVLMAWLIPMQISLTLWNVQPFWIYWGLYLYQKRGMGGDSLRQI